MSGECCLAHSNPFRRSAANWCASSTSLSASGWSMHVSRDFASNFVFDYVGQVAALSVSRMASGRSRRGGTVGPADDAITDREISKCLFCSAATEPGPFLAMMPPKAARAEAFIVDPRRGSPSPPPAPAWRTRRHPERTGGSPGGGRRGPRSVPPRTGSASSGARTRRTTSSILAAQARAPLRSAKRRNDVTLQSPLRPSYRPSYRP